MAIISGDLLRSATQEESSSLLDDRRGNSFKVRNTAIKRLRSTGAPVHFFDVLEIHGERIGTASLILEASGDAVRDFGHVCVTLNEDKSTSQLLADVAQLVFHIAYDLGLENLRVVIPDDHHISVRACELLEPCKSPERFGRMGKSFAAYPYQRNLT